MNNNDNSIDNIYTKTKNERSPASLDDLILSHAKESCKSSNPVTVKNRNWMYSLATAAVFVMGFSIILNLQNINQDMQVTPMVHEKPIPLDVDFVSEELVAPKPQVIKRKASHIKKLKKANNKAPSAKKKVENREEIGALYQDNEALDGSFSLKTKEPLTTPEYKSPKKRLNKKDIRLKNNTAKEEKQIATTPPAISPFKEGASINDDALGLPQESYNSVIIEEHELDNIMVTGLRKSDSQNALTDDIEKLERLISQKHIDKATVFLKELKQKYTDHDFSEYEKLIK